MDPALEKAMTFAYLTNAMKILKAMPIIPIATVLKNQIKLIKNHIQDLAVQNREITLKWLNTKCLK